MDTSLESLFNRKSPTIIDPKMIGEFSSSASVDISILILNYKTPTMVRQCLKSIEEHPPQGYSYEIIVIDNNSNDGLGQILDDEFPEVTFIPNTTNLGFPRAINQGIRVSKGQYVLLLNPDITILDDALTKLLKRMEQDEEIAVIGPKLMNPNGSIQYSCFSDYTTIPIVLYRRTKLGETEKGKRVVREFLMEDWDHASTKEVAWMLGSSLLVRRSAIAQVGLMDEQFFMYMEDVDWCRRFRDAGYKVTFYPEATMIHYYARGSATPNLIKAVLNRLTRIHIMSALKFWLKYKDAPQASIADASADVSTETVHG